MRRILSELRVALPLAVLLAAVGFVVAFATHDTSAEIATMRAVPVRSRDVIQPIRFTNPYLLAGTDFDFPNGGQTGEDPEGFDLGDAVEGQPLTRLLSAYGGFQPYKFSIKPLLGSGIASPGKGTPALPDLAMDGLLTSANLDTGLGAYLRFNAQLDDFIGSGRLGTFRLSLVTLPENVPQFAIDRLPTGVQGNSYFTTLDILEKPPSGSPAPGPVAYSLLPGTVRVGTAAVSTLEDTGLTLASDGRVYGRPITAGVISFAVQAKDSAGRLARSRDGKSASSQTVSLTVEPATVITTEMAARSVTIKGNRAVDNFDSLSYIGVFDLRGYTLPKLAGSAMTFRVGSATFKGTFDDRGTASFINAEDDAKVKLKISKTGGLTIKISNAVIGPKIGITADLNGVSNRAVVMAIETIGFRTTEVLNMPTKALANARFSMQYTLGTKGFSVAGAFQMLNCFGYQGKLDGELATRWQARFLVVPAQTTPSSDGVPTASTTLGNITSATVSIGSDFTQDLALTERNSAKPAPKGVLIFKAKLSDPGVLNFNLDPRKFVGYVHTNELLEADTGIPAAILTKNLTVFPLGFSVNGLGGQTGTIIAPNRSKWQQPK